MSAPIVNKDHFHAYLGVNVCGTWLPAAPAFDGPTAQAMGIHSHGDGLMHIHPYSSAAAGKNATVGRFLEDNDGAGWALDSTSMTLWDGAQHKNGDTCPSGEFKGKKANVVWATGHYGKPWNGTPRTGNPSDFNPQNADIVAIAFLPKGVKIPEPPDAESALANIQDLGGGAAASTSSDRLDGVDRHLDHSSDGSSRQHPVKAVVLVGGEGTRLRPLTYKTPKGLLPIANLPFLDRQLTWLTSHGVDDIVLSFGYLPEAFREHLTGDSSADEAHFGSARIRFRQEPEPLGTAGGIRFAAEGIDERLIVCNGDVLTDLDVRALVAFHEESGAEATIALTQVDDPSAFGVVPTRDDGEVVAFVEKPPPVGHRPTG